MHNDANPYQASFVDNPRPAVRRWSTKRRIAMVLFATPFILAPLVQYWVFHMAGSWFVSTDLEPEHRQVHLGMMYIPLMLSITVLAMFLCFLLLWMDRWHLVFSAIATMLFGVLLIPAILFFYLFVQSYLKFG
jgi:hypothetical protein